MERVKIHDTTLRSTELPSEREHAPPSLTPTELRHGRGRARPGGGRRLTPSHGAGRPEQPHGRAAGAAARPSAAARRRRPPVVRRGAGAGGAALLVPGGGPAPAARGAAPALPGPQALRHPGTAGRGAPALLREVRGPRGGGGPGSASWQLTVPPSSLSFQPAGRAGGLRQHQSGGGARRYLRRPRVHPPEHRGGLHHLQPQEREEAGGMRTPGLFFIISGQSLAYLHHAVVWSLGGSIF